MMMYVVYSRHIRFRQTHVLSITSETITDGHQNLAKTKCVSTCTILTDGFRDHAVQSFCNYGQQCPPTPACPQETCRTAAGSDKTALNGRPFARRQRSPALNAIS